MISRAGSSDFVIRRSQNPPTSPAAGFLEFLRPALAFRNGICALGRLAEIPSFHWVHPIGSNGRQLGRFLNGDSVWIRLVVQLNPEPDPDCLKSVSV